MYNQAEWLGNDNRKTMIKIKTTAQILSFEKRHDLPSPSPAPIAINIQPFADDVGQDPYKSYQSHPPFLLSY